MQTTPDLGEHTLWGRLANWAVGIIGLGVLQLWKFNRSEIKGIKADMARVAAELEKKADREALTKKADLEEMNRHREKLDALSVKVDEVKDALNEKVAEVKDNMNAQHVAQLTATHEMGKDLRTAIDALNERREAQR